jgi:suppressor of fused-like protein
MSDLPTEDGEPSTAGWDAITEAFDRLYSGQEPHHWGTLIHYILGGPDPLDGISAYLHDHGDGAAHWHFVSFGMSELYQKEWEDREVSGWGFEFTFRLRRVLGTSEPPQWPAGLMQNLARYVFNTGNVFAPGDHLPLNGPIALEEETALHAALLAEDPALGTIDTPNGKVQFLQLVGATMDELAAAEAWNTEKLLEVMRVNNPFLVTDLARESILDDSSTAQTVAEGTARDASSTGWFMVRELSVAEGPEGFGDKTLTICIGASGVRGFQALLRGRIAFGRAFDINGPSVIVTFAPAALFGWKIMDGGQKTQVALSGIAAQALAAALQPTRGDYSVLELPKLKVRIVPSEIKDHTGKKIVQVIG